MSQTPLIEARNLRRQFPGGDGWLLDGASLAVRGGERVAVTGPSGAGKTLLLRSLALLDPLDEGEVLWHGEPACGGHVPAVRSQCVYLHQRPALTGGTVELSMRQPLELGVHRERRFERERLLEWLGQLGRDESFLTKPPVELSGGERQIAALLRALQLEPSVLLLDEPTAALDASTTGAVEELLADWVNEAGGSRATVWVTHELPDAKRVAERVLIIHMGQVLEAANTDDIL